MLWHCWLGPRNSVWPIKIEWWGVGVVICIDWGAFYLHIVRPVPVAVWHLTIPSSLVVSKSWIVLQFVSVPLIQICRLSRPGRGPAGGQLAAPRTRCRSVWAAYAGSVMLRAEWRGSVQTCITLHCGAGLRVNVFYQLNDLLLIGAPMFWNLGGPVIPPFAFHSFPSSPCSYSPFLSHPPLHPSRFSCPFAPLPTMSILFFPLFLSLSLNPAKVSGGALLVEPNRQTIFPAFSAEISAFWPAEKT